MEVDSFLHADLGLSEEHTAPIGAGGRAVEALPKEPGDKLPKDSSGSLVPH